MVLGVGRRRGSIQGRVALVVALLLAASTLVTPDAGAATVTLVPYGSVWRYRDTGVDPGAAWRSTSYSDAGWASGPAQLGYGDGDEATTVGYGPNPADRYPTTWFRRTFTVDDAATVSGLDLSVIRDDGVAVYLNGTEVLRDNLPAGPLTATTWATTWDISETQPVRATVDPALLHSGTNTLAVEIHQAWRTSSDISFDLRLDATTTTVPPPPPPPPPPPAGDTGVLLATGDIARCGGAHPAVSEVLAAHPGTFAALGDIAYPNGTAAEFTECYDPWFGDEKARTRPVPGNHEYNTAGATGYYDYFGASAGPRGQGWYSYDLGAWHVIALNSECARTGGCGPGSPMYQWLTADLAATATPCIAAYWHHAPFSSEQGYVGPTNLGPVMQALEAAGTDVVLTGHSHIYERFTRLDAYGQPAPGGIRHFVVGTGGAGQRSLGTSRAGSEVRANSADGLLRLDLTPSGYSWRFLPVAGADFTDIGSDTCTSTTTAGAEFQPDQMTAFRRSGHLAGNDVYHSTGRHQSVQRRVGRGGTTTLYAPVENDGTATDRIRLTAAATGRGFAVRYLLGRTDVTNRVRAGNLVVEDLASGDQVTLQVVVTASRGARPGAVHRVRIEATSLGDPSRRDAVRLTVIRSGPGT